MKDMRAIELFAGAGGLAIGTALAGFEHELVAEWNHDACETIRKNQDRKVEIVRGWQVFEGDVRRLDYRKYQGKLDLIAGGPPCQPFSLGGKHRGHEDDRDMFPEAVRAVREAAPRAFLVENVKGLLRRSFATYFNHILLQLNHPEIIRKKSEEWPAHLARLERHHTGKNRHGGLSYQVVFRLLNAANYGVPQPYRLRRQLALQMQARARLNVITKLLETALTSTSGQHRGLLICSTTQLRRY